MTGTRNNVNKVDIITPPIVTTAMDARNSDPRPLSTCGDIPTAIAKFVRIIARTFVLQESIIARLKAMPFARRTFA